MGDSGLGNYLAIFAAAVLLAAAGLAAAAWRAHGRALRIAIGLGLMALGLLSGVVSLLAFALVFALGAAVLVKGIRTMKIR